MLIDYLTTSYVLSNGIFEERKGLIFKKSRAIPISNIDNVQVEYLAFIKGIGKIVVETPGESSNEIATEFWINNPDYLRNLLIG
ncbi:MAG: hypothetical protein OHK0017_10520 [Patescibacteria group bacterium]